MHSWTLTTPSPLPPSSLSTSSSTSLPLLRLLQHSNWCQLMLRCALVKKLLPMSLHSLAQRFLVAYGFFPIGATWRCCTLDMIPPLPPLIRSIGHVWCTPYALMGGLSIGSWPSFAPHPLSSFDFSHQHLQTKLSLSIRKPLGSLQEYHWGQRRSLPICLPNKYRQFLIPDISVGHQQHSPTASEG